MRLLTKIRRKVDKARFAPTIKVEGGLETVRLGSAYGGWSLEPSPDLYGATIVSAGLGEDATFDVEFATKFRARVIIVDPTPRAIAHYDSLSARMGHPAIQQYVGSGNQPVGSYDLSQIDTGSLDIVPAALWTEEGVFRFYSPLDAGSVSYSLVNLQGSNEKSYIEVPATTLEKILAERRLARLPLLKLDIEGAEVEVIAHFIQAGIRPRQLLVEYDEMNFPSAVSKRRVQATDALLRGVGYRCRHREGFNNFLYIDDCAEFT